MIVIGADTHKHTHALAAVDAGTGRVSGAREIKAEEPGHLAAVRWARGLDDERVWAIEDCRHVSRRLEQALIAAGERVVRVPPQRMGASRRGGARAGQIGPDRRARDRPGGRQGRRGALPRRPSGRASDGDPAALRSPQGSRRRAHPGAEPAALASARALPRARALTQARLARQAAPARADRPTPAPHGCLRPRASSHAIRSAQHPRADPPGGRARARAARAGPGPPPATARRDRLRRADRRAADRPHRRHRALHQATPASPARPARRRWWDPLARHRSRAGGNAGLRSPE